MKNIFYLSLIKIAIASKINRIPITIIAIDKIFSTVKKLSSSLVVIEVILGVSSLVLQFH